MQRDLDEVLESQEKMLARLERPAAARDATRPAFFAHLEKLGPWAALRSPLAVRYVTCSEPIARPAEEAARIGAFLGGRGDVDAMIGSDDPSLYRNHKASRPHGEHRAAGHAP